MVPALRTGSPDGASQRDLDESSIPAAHAVGMSSKCVTGTVNTTPPPLRHFGSKEPAAADVAR
jgi:hypothetical protein